MNELEQFRKTFFEECEELLQRFEQLALDLSPGPIDREVMGEIFRSVHSIKAGAGAFGFQRLVAFTHDFETFLDQARQDGASLTPSDPALIVQAGDILADLVACARQGDDAPEGHETQMLTRIQDRLGRETSEAADVEAAEVKAAPRDYRVRFKPFPSLYDCANEPQLLLRALEGLGACRITPVLDDIPMLDDISGEGGHLSWTIELRGVETEDAIREIFEFVEDECELTITALETDADVPQNDIPARVSAIETGGASDASPDRSLSTPQSVNRGQVTSIRVDLDRIDRLVDMVGELVIAQSMALESISQELGIGNIRHLQNLEDLALRTRQLQEGVMAVRMQPLKALFSRFPRVVRDLSGKLGKSVELVLEGEATEVDKTIIEELSDPLTHMIRNCIDHGLEDPSARVAAGKPEQGTIRLTAEQRNGRILIRVSDDGRGLDPDKVLAKAVEKGLVAPDEELGSDDIENLIFMPGFSTASSVSDVSGRGVGMDVVRSNIHKLGGRVSVESRVGKGTSFTLALPLTLAVLDGMLVKAAGEKYVLPLSAIIETVCPEPGQLREVPGGGQVLAVRGEVIRLVPVDQALGQNHENPDTHQRGLVVICETEMGRKTGLVVDELLGQQQVVIKSLETNYRRISGVAGTAILGDGRVRLILDIDGIAAIDTTRSETEEFARSA